MKDKRNEIWTMEDIAHQYKIENEEWPWRECWKKAKIIYRELNKMNSDMFRNTDKFYKNNTPFSFFESEDGEWSSIPELKEV